MKYFRIIAVSVLILLAFWKLYPHLTDFGKLFALKDQINYAFLFLGIIAQSGQYIGDGLLSQTLLKIIGVHMDFKNTIKIASLNVLAAHLFPVGEAGSIATAYYFYKKLGVSTQNFIFLSTSWTTITFSTLIAMLISSIYFIPHLPTINLNAVGTVLIALLVIIPVLFFTFKEFIWGKIKAKIQKLDVYKGILEYKENFPTYKGALFSHKLLVAEAIFAALVYYGTNIVTLSFSFLTFGIYPPISVLIFAYTLSMISGWVTLSPAGLGAAEATLILVFLQFGIDPVHALASVLVFRLITFWIPIPAGAYSYMSLKKQIKKEEKLKSEGE